MKNPTALLAAIGALALSGLFAFKSYSTTAIASTTTSAALIVVPQPASAPVSPVLVPLVVTKAAARYEHLRAYVLGVIQTWPKAAKALPVLEPDSIAADIAAAVAAEPATVEETVPESGFGRACPPVSHVDAPDDLQRCGWRTRWDSDGAKAVLMASLAYWEGSRFAAYVDANLCTDPAWRAVSKKWMLLGGDCDGGHAHSLWQIHPINHDPVGSTYTIAKFCNQETVDHSRFEAARCALELAHRSVAATGTLQWYTGEPSFDHPKADKRMNFALDALHDHPFEP